jgi:adenylyltransferase/sulfurtransferase
MLGKPNVYGSIFRFEGQATVFYPKEGGPCYRCLYPEPPPPGLVPSCAEGGVLGVLPGVIGTVQATEAIKLIAGIGETLVGRLMLYDALAMRFRELKLRRNPDCPVCGDHPTVTELIDYEQFCGIVPEPEQNDSSLEITPIEVAAWLKRDDPPFLLDVREPNEWNMGRIPRAIHLPRGHLESKIEGMIDRKQKVVVYCARGNRSALAALTMKQMGYENVSSMARGIQGWADIGGEIEG